MAITRLPNMGMECSYNGVTWGPSADTTMYTVRPNLDPSGRTVMSATYGLVIEEYIHDAATTDAVILDKIARLSRNAGELRYKGRGFGDTVLNVGPGKRDVKWGPHTQYARAEAVGAGRTVKLSWSVEWTTVNCPDGLTKAGTILQFTYGVTYDIDREGYTTRTVESSLTIAATKKKVDDKTLDAVADEHREKMVPKLPDGFRPDGQSYRIDLAKTTITGTFRQVQMSGVMPPLQVVEAHVEHSYQSRGLLDWVGTLSAEYTIYRVANATPAIVAFARTLDDRIKKATAMRVGDAVKPFGLGDEAARGDPVRAIPLAATATEADIYGRQRVNLSLTYTIAGIGFGAIFSKAGLWTGLPPVETVAWRDWVASVGDISHPRGHARLVLRPNDDAIVDACVPGATPAPPKNTSGQSVRPANVLGNLTQTLADAFPAPPPARSWLAYRAWATVHADTGRVVGTTLPTEPITASQTVSGQSFDAFAGPTAQVPSGSPFPPLAGELVARASAGESFIHSRTRPKLYLTVSGVALRVGYAVPVPEVVSINGKRPVLVGQPWFTQGVAHSSISPIVRAEWQMTYLFTDEGGGAPLKPVPVPSGGLLG